MTALKVEGVHAEWIAVDAGGTQFTATVAAKLPSITAEEIIAQGEFRVNVPSTEVWKSLTLPSRVAGTNEAVSSKGDNAGLVPEVVQQFAKLFAKEIISSGSFDSVKATPPVFRGTSDKLTPGV